MKDPIIYWEAFYNATHHGTSCFLTKSVLKYTAREEEREHDLERLRNMINVYVLCNDPSNQHKVFSMALTSNRLMNL